MSTLPDLENADHETFQTWRLAHPRGFVLNAGKILHVAECIHFGAMGRPRVRGQWDLGTTEKVCGLSKAKVTAGRAVKSCQSCNP
jgi:hypothetical protein